MKTLKDLRDDIERLIARGVPLDTKVVVETDGVDEPYNHIVFDKRPHMMRVSVNHSEPFVGTVEGVTFDESDY